MINLTPAAFALCLALPVYADGPSAIDWTNTVADIRSQEQVTPQNLSEKRLTYEAELKGEKYHLEYLFGDQGTLINVLYYKAFPADGDDCLREYQRVRSAYHSELGAPKAETTAQRSVLTLYGTGHECRAVANGEVAINAEWTLGSASNMNVLLSVWKDKPYVGVSITPLRTEASQ